MKGLQHLLVVGLICSILPADVQGNDSCDSPCVKIWDPVCGSDGKTYGNSCMFDNAKCRDSSLTSTPGSCDNGKKRGTDTCDNFCIDVYDPVCGSDGKTYSNPCYFANAKCRDSSLTSSPGACSD